jgi:hypothetical protein
MPSPAEHLRLFLASVADYERLDAAYPLANELHHRGHGDDEQRRWQVVLHAAVLRKYFAPNDTLFIGAVLRSLRSCLIPIWDWTDADWEEAFEYGPQIADTAQVAIGDQAPLGESDILRDELYGRFLHGDHKKWIATTARPTRVIDNGVFFATVHQKFRLYDTVRFVREMSDGGFLMPPSAPPG